MGLAEALPPEPSASHGDGRRLPGGDGGSGRAWKGDCQAPIQVEEGFPAREGATDVQFELAGASQDPSGNLDQFLDDRLNATPLGG